jgi:hypothetical protein
VKLQPDASSPIKRKMSSAVFASIEKMNGMNSAGSVVGSKRFRSTPGIKNDPRLARIAALGTKTSCLFLPDPAAVGQDYFQLVIRGGYRCPGCISPADPTVARPGLKRRSLMGVLWTLGILDDSFVEAL